jgi:hypothetical protein
MIPVKFLVLLRGEDRMEVEIEDCFPSAQMHIEGIGHCESPFFLSSIEVQNISAYHLPAPTLLAYKLSHLALPLQWRKTATDFALMLDCIGKPLRQILSHPVAADPNSCEAPDLKEFLKARLAENVAVNYTLQGHAPSCIRDASDERLSLKTREELDALLNWTGASEKFLILFVEAPAGCPPAQTFSTPFLPLKMSLLKFNALDVAQKRRILTEIVILVAVQYFLRDHRLRSIIQSSSAKDDVFAEEAYLCALETICTRCIAASELSTRATLLDVDKARQSRSFQSWWKQISVYNGGLADYVHSEERRHMAPQTSSKSIQELLYSWEMMEHPTRLPGLKFPTAAEIASLGIPASDPLVNMMFAEMSHLISFPPLMVALTGKYRIEIDSLAAASAAPVIVDDVWKLVMKDYIHDHVTIQRLRRTNRQFKNWLTLSEDSGGISDEIWTRLLAEAWRPKTVQKYTPKGRKARSAEDLFKDIWTVKWRRAHREIYICGHCSRTHYVKSIDEWYAENGGEFTRDFCPCPECHDHTKSWARCAYHSLYIR